MDITEKLKKDIQEQFLNFKKEKMVSLLVDFIENKAPLLIENPEDLRVVTFEVDRPFDFIYGAYPDPNVIPQGYWLTQFVIDAGEEDDDEKLEAILANNNLNDDGEWIDMETDEDIELWEIYDGLEKGFFSECWQLAKSQTSSNLRCFFLEHDVYRGIDADTGKEIEDNQIIDVLKSENFEFRIFEEPTKAQDNPQPEQTPTNNGGITQWLASLFRRK